MSKDYEHIKQMHDDGVKPWCFRAAIANAVKKGKITAEEYELIIGEPYAE